MNLEIRSATLTDEAAVIALWRDAGLVVAHNDPSSDFRFALAGPASEVLIAVDEQGNAAGSVMVGHDGHRGWMYYVAANPDHRRHGVGRRLVAAAEQWLKDRGVAKVQLMIRETNTEVAKFYARLGYEVTPRTVMAKWIGGPNARA